MNNGSAPCNSMRVNGQNYRTLAGSQMESIEDTISCTPAIRSMTVQENGLGILSRAELVCVSESHNGLCG